MGTTKEVKSSAEEAQTSSFRELSNSEVEGTIWGQAVQRIMAKAKERGDEHEHEHEEETLKSEQAKRLHDVWETLKEQGVPERVVDYVLPTEDNHFRLRKTTALVSIQAWAESQEKSKLAWSFTIAGGKGCGKSIAAGYWLFTKASRRLTLAKRTWWPAARLTRECGYNSNMDEIMSVPYMVIDDLGMEYMDKNRYFNSRLDEIFEERSGNYLPTLITTNLNGHDFRERYGDRITDRMKDGFRAGGGFIEIKDKSLRGA